MKNKSPLWIALTVVVILAALYFVRPQSLFPSDEFSYTQITAYGQDVTDQVDEAALSQVLSQLKGSRMFSSPEESQEAVRITGTCQGEPFTLVMGEYSTIHYNDTDYRIRSASDLLVELYDILPEEVLP
jgi:hypothetical protein